MADEIESYQMQPTPIKTVIPALRTNSKAIILNSCIMDPTYYDLLGGNNTSFRVIFDIRTPRPHFILLPKFLVNIGSDFSQLTLDQRKDLMKAVQPMMLSQFSEISGGILSIHRGSWVSNRDEFHAHLSVDKGFYLQIFYQEKHKIPEKSWPKYVNAESYRSQVDKYPRKSYFNDEVDAIKELKLETNVNLRLSVQQLMNEVGEVEIQRLFLHPSEPKIGFVGKKDEIHLENLVWAMERFAKFLGLTNPDSDDGCHLCLHFGSGKFNSMLTKT